MSDNECASPSPSKSNNNVVSNYHKEKMNYKRKIKFQGKIKKGVKEGYGIEYYPNGKLRYDGNFKRNKYHGKRCKLYNENGNIEYSGSILRGNKMGGDC